MEQGGANVIGGAARRLPVKGRQAGLLRPVLEQRALADPAPAVNQDQARLGAARQPGEIGELLRAVNKGSLCHGGLGKK